MVETGDTKKQAHADRPVQLRVGEMFPTVRFEPIGKSQVWEMAALARDFNPLHLFSRSGPECSRAPLRLHPLWLTSLAELGIRSLIPGAVVRELVMEYAGPAYLGQPQAVAITVDAVGPADGTASLGLTIVGPRGETLATGSARVILPSGPSARED
ncbi:MAG: hypothetical protein AB1646_18130 [Thermodesulfobacteriota bacterium]